MPTPRSSLRRDIASLEAEIERLKQRLNAQLRKSYWSESKGGPVPLADMHQHHIRNAIRKRGVTPVQADLLDELVDRLDVYQRDFGLLTRD